MLTVVLDDHQAHCPNATELIQLADTDADSLLTAAEAQTMAYILLPCLEEYTCGHGAALNVTVLVCVGCWCGAREPAPGRLVCRHHSLSLVLGPLCRVPCAD